MVYALRSSQPGKLMAKSVGVPVLPRLRNLHITCQAIVDCVLLVGCGLRGLPDKAASGDLSSLSFRRQPLLFGECGKDVIGM